MNQICCLLSLCFVMVVVGKIIDNWVFCVVVVGVGFGQCQQVCVYILQFVDMVFDICYFFQCVFFYIGVVL